MICRLCADCSEPTEKRSTTPPSPPASKGSPSTPISPSTSTSPFKWLASIGRNRTLLHATYDDPPVSEKIACFGEMPSSRFSNSLSFATDLVSKLQQTLLERSSNPSQKEDTVKEKMIGSGSRRGRRVKLFKKEKSRKRFRKYLQSLSN